jgi:hypothetical protein
VDVDDEEVRARGIGEPRAEAEELGAEATPRGAGEELARGAAGELDGLGKHVAPSRTASAGHVEVDPTRIVERKRLLREAEVE